MEHRVHRGVDDRGQDSGAEPDQLSSGLLRKVRLPYPFNFRRPHCDTQQKARQPSYSQFHGQLKIFVVCRLGTFPIADNGVFYGETILKRSVLIHAKPNPQRMVTKTFRRIFPNFYPCIGVGILLPYVQHSLFQGVRQQDCAENQYEKQE